MKQSTLYVIIASLGTLVAIGICWLIRAAERAEAREMYWRRQAQEAWQTNAVLQTQLWGKERPPLRLVDQDDWTAQHPSKGNVP